MYLTYTGTIFFFNLSKYPCFQVKGKKKAICDLYQTCLARSISFLLLRILYTYRGNKILCKENYISRMFGWLSWLRVQLLILARVVISGLRDWVPHWALLWAWSLLMIFSLPLLSSPPHPMHVHAHSLSQKKKKTLYLQGSWN